jgi:hypothetical protein
MSNYLLILPENNLISVPENNLTSTVLDNGNPLINIIIDDLSDIEINKKDFKVSLSDFLIDSHQSLIDGHHSLICSQLSLIPIQQSLIDNNLYYTKTKNIVNLLKDVGVLYFDHNTNDYQFEPFKETYNTSQKLRKIGILLGYTAEAMVVRECNSDVSKNAKWANIARLLREDRENINPINKFVKNIFRYIVLQNPNNYHAIGTGLATTKNTHSLRGWYSRHSARDICWIDSAKVRELLVLNNITKGKLRNAGIQLKVSTNRSGSYVTEYFKKQSVHNLYPVVYFDLGDDFYKVKQKLLNLSASDVYPNSLFSDDVEFSENISRSDIVDMMLYRGRDVDRSLHEELLYYQYIFHNLAFGKIRLMELINNDKVIHSLIIDYAEKNVICDSPLLTIPYI